ncbi:hypothetical protein SSX86_016575 [Deinandra increscens subsp. villosa]|uniref:Amidase domain-containing protein n=1 Tax=Deinandra increscens subsp. villosa TaxID=3103831 RepID=A0AAP0D3L3_9ASTR
MCKSIYFSLFLLVLLALLSFCQAHKEATIHELRLELNNNRINSRQLVEFYLGEIKKLNPVLKGVLEVNPDVLYEADRADRERAAKVPRSMVGLHGIPVLLKDTIATRDKLNTTAGSFALLGSIVPRDAGIVSRLRKAGAIILGKASLSEWSSFRSLGAPSGFSPRGGQGKNPYVLSATPCGSSSGPAISVAANMVAVSIGTETDGSILCPASFNSVVGIKPTVGLTSRAGVIPISPSLDTVGHQGAILIDNLEITGLDTILNATASGEAVATIAEFKIAINGFLKSLDSSRIHSLADIIEFNQKFGDLEKIAEFGQEIFLAAEATNGIMDLEKAAIANMATLTRNGYLKMMAENRLDAVVTPGSNISPVLAIGGFPAISVPAAYDDEGVPVGICFSGLQGSEATLIEVSYGFEQATNVRKLPTFLS